MSHTEYSFGGGLIKKVIKNLNLNNSKTARVQILILSVQISTNSGLYNDVSHIEYSFGGGANFISN